MRPLTLTLGRPPGRADRGLNAEEGSPRAVCQLYPASLRLWFSSTDSNQREVKKGYKMNIGAKTTDTIAISFRRMLRAGPAVSLNGSPTVSPVTAAL